MAAASDSSESWRSGSGDSASAAARCGTDRCHEKEKSCWLWVLLVAVSASLRRMMRDGQLARPFEFS